MHRAAVLGIRSFKMPPYFSGHIFSLLICWLYVALGLRGAVTGIYLLCFCLLPGCIVPSLFAFSKVGMESWRRVTKFVFFPIDTLLFAAAAAYHSVREVRHGTTAAGADPFWGPLSAGIDWCETNYGAIPFLAEFWNSLSSVWMVVLGGAGALACYQCGHPARFTVAYGLFTIVGVGSVAFHGMMTHASQFCDEVPMIWMMVSLVYIFLEDLGGRWKPTWLGPALTMYGAVCTMAIVLNSHPLVFQLPFFVAVLGVTWGRFQKKPVNPVEDTLLQLGWTSLFPAMFAWPVERLLCPTLPVVEHLQLHSLWHIFIGLGLHMHLQALIFSHYHGRPTAIKYALFGVLPIVVSKSAVDRQ